jgi:hypothetical protein
MEPHRGRKETLISITNTGLEVSEANARTRNCITDEQVKFFLGNSFLVIRQVLVGEELAAIQAAMAQLYQDCNSTI